MPQQSGPPKDSAPAQDRKHQVTLWYYDFPRQPDETDADWRLRVVENMLDYLYRDCDLEELEAHIESVELVE